MVFCVGVTLVLPLLVTLGVTLVLRLGLPRAAERFPLCLGVSLLIFFHLRVKILEHIFITVAARPWPGVLGSAAGRAVLFIESVVGVWPGAFAHTREWVGVPSVVTFAVAAWVVIGTSLSFKFWVSCGGERFGWRLLIKDLVLPCIF